MANLKSKYPRIWLVGNANGHYFTKAKHFIFSWFLPVVRREVDHLNRWRSVFRLVCKCDENSETREGPLR